MEIQMTGAEDRFWIKVAKTDTCWYWVGVKNNKGYGNFSVGGRRGGMVLAHRFSYEMLIGPIPDRLTIDHLCRNKSCVRPDHLEAVDTRTNILRGEGVTANNAKKTHCLRGHLFDTQNTYMTTTKKRVCRSCANIRVKNFRSKIHVDS